jgi:hypothetical protein
VGAVVTARRRHRREDDLHDAVQVSRRVDLVRHGVTFRTGEGPAAGPASEMYAMRADPHERRRRVAVRVGGRCRIVAIAVAGRAARRIEIDHAVDVQLRPDEVPIVVDDAAVAGGAAIGRRVRGLRG